MKKWIWALPLLALAGCATPSADNGAAHTVSTKPPCPQISSALDALSKVSLSAWNKPISSLSSDRQNTITAAGVAATEKASVAYGELIGGPSWKVC